MSDNKVTLDQLDNSAVEAMTASIGDVNTLNTENKTIVGALAEIVGKKEIADAIGEPLAETDKFTEMSSEINGLLSAFKTNMMNAGVVVESGDKFKALIDKIKGLTEGEGIKGIQIAEGQKTVTTDFYYSVDDLAFRPYIVICKSYYTGDDFALYVDSFYTDKYIASHGINSSNNNGRASLEYGYVTDNGFSLYHSGARTDVSFNYIAIGVGEEDTSLRDSLADILENKGVELSGGETLEELIIKVGKLEAKLPPLYLYQEGVINTELIGDLIYSTDSDINYPTYTPGETDFYIGTHQTNSAASANLTAKNAIDTLKYRKICIDCETTCTGEDGPRVKFSFAGSELDITTSQNRQIVSFYFIPSKNAIFRLSAGNSFGWNGQAYTRVYNIWLEDEL